LKQGDKQYFCANGHSFDLAKQGYVNLLLPRDTGSAAPGDNREMLRSRREFLDGGYYAKFSAAVCQEIAPSKSSRVDILDAGCGEGYYLRAAAETLQDMGRQAALYGIDVSKSAIRYAAGRYKQIRFAVASNYHLPIRTRSVDCLLCIFAPRCEAEFSRVLKPEGNLIVAAPGPRHLVQLRELLYECPPPIGERGTMGDGFRLARQSNVRYEIFLTSHDLLNLFLMTPFSRHADKQLLEGIDSLACEVDFRIFVYQKR
jgi:23S rRNA (guanine745-N1)-methyltransferase